MINITVTSFETQPLNKRYIFAALIFNTVVCLCGNPFVIYIYSRKEFFKHSIFRYMTLSAVVDLLPILLIWMENYRSVFGLNTYFVGCKAFDFFKYLPNIFRHWILSCASIDRLISVKYPKNDEFRDKFQKFALSVVFISLCLINTPNVFVSNITSKGCATTNFSLGAILAVFNAIIGNVVPGTVDLFCACYIYYSLIRRKKKLREKFGNLKEKHDFNREVQFLKILVSLTIYFFVCTLPYCFTATYYLIIGKPFRNTLIIDLLLILANMHSSCDFFIHFFSNKLFQKRFISLITCSRSIHLNNSTCRSF